MPSIGETLRQARLDRRLTLSELAERTRVSARYLEAIESDDAQALPGGFFYRSFIKLYADAVGVDGNALLRKLDPGVGKAEEDVLPVLSASYVPAGRMARGPRYRIPLALGALVATLVAGSFLYSWWDRTHRTEPVVSEPQAATVPSVAAKPEPAPAVPPQVEPPAAPVPTGTVQLAATERTWVSLSANGKTLFSGVLQTSETRRFEGIEQAKLVTGNAAGLGVEWNGRDIGPIGPRGQVRTVLLEGGEARILSPRGTL